MRYIYRHITIVTGIRCVTRLTDWNSEATIPSTARQGKDGNEQSNMGNHKRISRNWTRMMTQTVIVVI